MEEKKAKRSISLSPDILAQAQAEADAHHGGNLSAYFSGLHEDSRAGKFETRRPDILMLLVRDYRRSDLEIFRELLGVPPLDGDETFDQVVIVHRFLEALRKALAANRPGETAFDPEQTFHLIDAHDVTRWEAMSESRLMAAARTLASTLNKDGARAMLRLAAEDGAKYPDKNDGSPLAEIEAAEEVRRAVVRKNAAEDKPQKPRPKAG